MSPHLLPGRSATLLALFGLALGHNADAAIYTVGAPGSGCTFTSVQAAVNAAQANPGADIVRISRSQTWSAQQISIVSDHDLDLVGGFATCASATPDGTRTILSGAGGQARPVLTVRSSGLVRLRNLIIRDGDQAGDDLGGGINYLGGGILDLADTDVTANNAHDGGGIYAVGTSLQAELVMGPNVIVSANVARNSGGGVVAKSIEMSLRGPGSSILFNEALGLSGGGYGGGLVVVSAQFRSYAYISSDGIGGIGAVYGNEAVYGGGIAVLGGVESGREAEVHVFSTDSTNPVRINVNSAASRGGGIYLKTDTDESSGDADAVARLWNVALSDNTAGDGAAAYLDFDEGLLLGTDEPSRLYFNDTLDNVDPPPSAAPCPLDRPCGYVTGNSTGNASGAIIRIPRGYLQTERVIFQDNQGGRVIHQSNDSGNEFEGSLVRFGNSLFTGNVVSNELMLSQSDVGGFVTLDNVTIADNSIGAPHVLRIENHLAFRSSLVSEPGKLTLAASSGSRDIQYVLTNDNTNMGMGPAAVAAPRFVDAANGDFRLRAGARAIDYASNTFPINVVGAFDLHGHPRVVDVPIAGINAPNRHRDVGAYERPALQPLVLNSDFNADLNLWEGLSDSFWDGSQNASGPAGSGSARVPLQVDPELLLAGRSQCIHLPGPGWYRLNGWGRVSPGSNPPITINRARLVWELRYNGGAMSCESGAPNFSGVHQVATGTTWTRPASAATIEVPPAVWTQHTSLTIKLDVTGALANPPTAWFDGITLDIDGSDTIFANGFQ